MAEYLSSTFGKIIGRHGTAVAVIRDGQPILRVYTPPSNPRTPAQIAHRERFKFTHRNIYPLRPVINQTYGKSSTGFGNAFAAAWDESVSGDYPNFTFDWTKLPLSYGLIVSPLGVTATLTGGQITLNWSTTVYENCAADDKLFVVLYDAASRALLFHRAQAERSVGTTQVAMPAEWQLADLKVWMYFSTSDLVKNSPSVYVTVTEQP